MRAACLEGGASWRREGGGEGETGGGVFHGVGVLDVETGVWGGGGGEQSDKVGAAQLGKSVLRKVARDTEILKVLSAVRSRFW